MPTFSALILFHICTLLLVCFLAPSLVRKNIPRIRHTRSAPTIEAVVNDPLDQWAQKCLRQACNQVDSDAFPNESVYTDKCQVNSTQVTIFQTLCCPRGRDLAADDFVDPASRRDWMLHAQYNCSLNKKISDCRCPSFPTPFGLSRIRQNIAFITSLSFTPADFHNFSFLENNDSPSPSVNMSSCITPDQWEQLFKDIMWESYMDYLLYRGGLISFILYFVIWFFLVALAIYFHIFFTRSKKKYPAWLFGLLATCLTATIYLWVRLLCVKVETTSGNGSTSESQADDPGSDPQDEESPEADPLASVPVGPITIPPCFNAEAIISPSFGTHGARARNDSPDPLASMLGNASVATARSFMSNDSRYHNEDELCRGARLKRRSPTAPRNSLESHLPDLSLGRKDYGIELKSLGSSHSKTSSHSDSLHIPASRQPLPPNSGIRKNGRERSPEEIASCPDSLPSYKTEDPAGFHSNEGGRPTTKPKTT